MSALARTITSPAPLRLHQDHAPRPCDPGFDRPDNWIPITDAYAVLGYTDARGLRKRCKEKLARKGFARLMSGRSVGREQWHVHRSVDARLQKLEEEATTDDRGAITGSSVLDAIAQAPKSKRDQATKKARAVVMFRQWKSSPGVMVSRDFDRFRARLRDELGISPSKTRLYAWNKQCPASTDFDGCVATMLDNRTGSARSAAVSDEFINLMIALTLSPERPSFRSCYRRALAVAETNNWAACSISHAERIYKDRTTKAERDFCREGEREWQARYQTPIEQDPESYAPGEMWEADHTKLDCMVRTIKRVDGEYQYVAARAWLTCWMDWRTRTILGWRVGLEADTDAVRQAFVSALRNNLAGVPRKVWLDNGKDFASAAIGGLTKAKRRRLDTLRRVVRDIAASPDDIRAAREEMARLTNDTTGGLLGMVGVEPHFARAYNHNGKARIERMFSIVHEELCKRMPGYVGNAPGAMGELERKASTADTESLPTIEDVEREAASVIDWINHATDHRIEDLRDPETGQPLARIEYLRKHQQSRQEFKDERALTLLAQHYTDPLAVSKRGIGVKIGHRTTYFGGSSDLLRPYKNTKTRFRVGYDPQDLSRVRVYTEDLALVGEVEMNNLIDRGADTPLSKQALKEGQAQQRAERREMARVRKLYTLSAGDAEIAGRVQRERDIAATKARMAKTDKNRDELPNVRLVTTPLDGAAEQLDRQRMRRAAGAESSVTADARADFGPAIGTSIIDVLSDAAGHGDSRAAGDVVVDVPSDHPADHTAEDGVFSLAFCTGDDLFAADDTQDPHEPEDGHDALPDLADALVDRMSDEPHDQTEVF